MMKLKYSICCGLDVHKNVIVATIVITNKDGISEYLQKSFSTINSDIQRFHNWLIENNCYHVCMESTEKYWIPIFNYLESDMDVCLTHPQYVKAIKSQKTDKKDSRWCQTPLFLVLAFSCKQRIRRQEKICPNCKSRRLLKNDNGIMCALAASKNKKQPYFAIKYGRIKKRRGHKKQLL